MSVPPHSGNLFDAGASSATKHTDQTEGIHEDISSDLVRESGKQGSILDNLGGPAHGLGHDAKARAGGIDTGASSATKTTDLTEGIHEDVSRTAKGVGSSLLDESRGKMTTLQREGQNAVGSVKEGVNSMGEKMSSGGKDDRSFVAPPGTSNASESMGHQESGPGLMERVKENLGSLVGRDSHSTQAQSSMGIDRSSQKEEGALSRNTAGGAASTL